MFEIKHSLADESYKYVDGVLNYHRVPFKEEQQVKRVCGLNDWAVVQLLLYAEEEMVVGISDQSYFYKKGPIDIVRVKVEVPGIDQEQVKLNLVGLVEDDDHQLKSDILLADPFIYVKPRQVQAVWIEIQTDQNTEPGTYYPEIKLYRHNMFEDESLYKTLTFQLEIKEVRLANPEDYQFYLDLWQHNSNIARKYNVELWSDQHFAIIENYLKALAQLGQKAISVVVSEIPWSGQHSAYNNVDPSDLFEYNIVKIHKKSKGDWEYDFSVLNRYIKLCLQYGINQEIEVFGLSNIWVLPDVGFTGVIEDFPDAIRLRYFNEKTASYRFVRRKKDLMEYIKALNSNFIEQGWQELIRVVADEPADLDQYRQRLQEMLQIAPSFKFKVAINDISVLQEDLPGVVDYVPILNCLYQDYSRVSKLKESINGRLLYYVCCIPDQPNTFIASPLLEGRLLPWLSWYLGLDGFLRWNFTAWPDEPLKQISYKYPLWKAGDTSFVYPGKNGKPLFSLRYKNLKRGIRDFQLFQQYLAETGEERTAWLTERIQSVFLQKSQQEVLTSLEDGKEKPYTLEYDDYEVLMKEILNMLG